MVCQGGGTRTLEGCLDLHNDLASIESGHVKSRSAKTGQDYNWTIPSHCRVL
jgi:hypothetical protein